MRQGNPLCGKTIQICLASIFAQYRHVLPKAKEEHSLLYGINGVVLSFTHVSRVMHCFQ